MSYTSRLEVHVGQKGKYTKSMKSKGRFSKVSSKTKKGGNTKRIPNYYEDSSRACCMRMYSDKDEKPVDPNRDDSDDSDDEVEEIMKNLITVKAVNFNIKENAKAHHTDEYDLTNDIVPNLVIRRGQPFFIDIDFDRDFDEKTEDLSLTFATGKMPSITKGSKVDIILSKEDKSGEWGAAIKEKKGKTVKLQIFTSKKCPVGKWCFQVKAFKKSTNPDKAELCKVYSHSKLIYILFNPWCKDDTVYHPNSQMLQEYVLNESGKIYIGSMRYIRGRNWAFDQFENPVLDCVLDLLDREGLSAKDRGEPVKVVRKLTGLVNSCDNSGILAGNWSGDYEEGTSPVKWTGSLDILKEYYMTKEPVKFGQCWVFSGIMTTCCRTLGIPVRSVTNFCSAHDTDGSMTIDRVIGVDGKEKEEFSTDSVWNFHVWNDVWMARPDLTNDDYGGWQACDATPQETSDGTYCCGPCPLVAIKKGEVETSFDGRFVFAEVNGDKITWFEHSDGSVTKKIKKNQVGFFISTYRPECVAEAKWFSGMPCFDRNWQDVTNDYKFSEDTGAERASVLRANQESSKEGIYDQVKEGCEDVIFKTVLKEKVCYGEPIEWEYNIENKSKETRHVEGQVSLRSVYYTGVNCPCISSVPVKEVVAPGKVVNLKLAVPFDEYFGSIQEGCHFSVHLIAYVKETKQNESDKETIVLVKPELTIKAPAIVTVGKKFQADISFTNPLPTSLTGTELAVSGSGQETKYKPGLVEKHKTFMYQVEITPRKPGKKKYTFVFNSTELGDVTGMCEVEVKNV